MTPSWIPKPFATQPADPKENLPKHEINLELLDPKLVDKEENKGED